jgi:hypothetical protein
MQPESLALTPDEVADGGSWEDVVVVETSLAGVGDIVAAAGLFATAIGVRVLGD